MSRYLVWYLYDSETRRGVIEYSKDFGLVVHIGMDTYVLDDEYLEQIEQGHHRGLRLVKPKKLVIKEFFNQ